IRQLFVPLGGSLCSAQLFTEMPSEALRLSDICASLFFRCLPSSRHAVGCWCPGRNLSGFGARRLALSGFGAGLFLALDECAASRAQSSLGAPPTTDLLAKVLAEILLVLGL